MSDFVYAVPDEYPTHPGAGRAAVQLEDWLNGVAAAAIQAAVEQFDAKLVLLRSEAALLDERLQAMSSTTFLPLAEVLNLSTNMDLAQKELANARDLMTGAYQRKVLAEDERKVAEAVVALSEDAKGGNDHERKYKLAQCLGTDGDYRQVASVARQAEFLYEELQGEYAVAEKKHQACRAVLELYAGWLNSLS